MMSGLYFEDWIIGHVYESRRRRVTLEEVQQFATLEGSNTPMHHDPEYAAKNTVWGRVTLHGMLTMTVASGLMAESGYFAGTGVALLSLTWEFLMPLYLDDEISVRWWVSEKRPTRNTSRGLIVRKIEVTNQTGVCVCKGTMTSLSASRSTQATSIGSSGG